MAPPGQGERRFSCRPIAVFNVYSPKTGGIVDQRFMPEKSKEETGWLVRWWIKKDTAALFHILIEHRVQVCSPRSKGRPHWRVN